MAQLYNSSGLEIATTPVALRTGTTSGSANWTVRTTTSPGSTLKVKLYTADRTLESDMKSIKFTLNSSSDTEYYYSASNITFSIYTQSQIRGSDPTQTTVGPYSLTNPNDGSESNNDDTSSLDDVINEYINEQ